MDSRDFSIFNPACQGTKMQEGTMERRIYFFETTVQLWSQVGVMTPLSLTY